MSERPDSALNNAAPDVNTTPEEVNTAVFTEPVRQSEEAARAFIADPVNAHETVRALATATGWSVGWVAARRAELRHTDDGEAAA